MPALDLIRGSGVGCLGGFLAGPVLAVIYYLTAWTGTTLYGFPAAILLFALWGAIVGSLTGPVVFWIERRGGEVGFRRAALFGALTGLVIGGAIDLVGALVTGRWSEVGLYLFGLPTLLGFAAGSAGLFAKSRRKRLAWKGKQP
jgi:hypothetical protein